ncbi:acid phosphatase [Solilutibacter silvestris]|uniref:Burkholderia-type acid phosphatase n=1 Tax=Solilutibacter silvestris TaxID=1645665 RepID=A0A2K1PZF2_9GAMM|nr:acid phosphatase [Lysobacter silvestris]PNS08161.1 Burkholderia-type acid phosphatase [Lysobacter silvestris]
MMRRLARIVPVAVAIAVLGACQTTPGKGSAGTGMHDSGLDAIQTIVVIYAENRSFDNLYGNFPGANGVQHLKPGQYLQRDRDGSLLQTLPPVPGQGLTVASDPKQITTEATRGHPNRAYALDDPNGYGVSLDYKLHDLIHAFYNQQMQINGGKNDKFAAWSDAGGESMGYFDGSQMAMWQVARKYVLADNFFHGAFGSSFLNHQYLICACAPTDFKTQADPKKYQNNISVVNDDGVSLKVDAKSPASALDGPPKYVHYGVLTPDFRAVNTMMPPYAPSGKPAPKNSAEALDRITLSPQSAETIGDRLSAANIGWAWYSGGWQIALDGGKDAEKIVFQYHHQPFNYYTQYAPGTAARTEHLRDGGLDGAKFIADIDAGKLPPVAFYKPQGNLNQHAGYASVSAGDQHIADVIAHLERSPQWKNMVVIVTYDENGGWWDHVAPPKADRWGPGLRIPSIIVSPFAKRGVVDHTQYDTGSIQRLINHRFGLVPLPGILERDAALKAHGEAAMGDFTSALELWH